MRQRVCIARTLVLQPRLILLDEPFGALDEQTRLLMGDEVLRLWRETGATILLITHSLDEATMLSERVGVMSARPGCFIDIIETHWPHDRDSRIASAPEFGAITARLWELLRDESIKAMRAGRSWRAGQVLVRLLIVRQELRIDNLRPIDIAGQRTDDLLRRDHPVHACEIEFSCPQYGVFVALLAIRSSIACRATARSRW